MRRIRNLITIYAAVGLFVFGIAGNVDAQRRNEREIRDIIRSLSAKIDDFQYGLDYQLKSSSANRRDIDGVRQSLRGLQDKIDEFDRNFAQKRENRDDVNDIISAANGVDEFLNQNRQNRRIGTDWASIRDMIGRLASNYGVTPDWNGGDSRDLPTTDRDTGNNYPSTNRDPNNYPAPNRPSILAVGLTGTYQLDTTRSENTADIITRTNVSASQRDDLQSKLDAPEQIALDIRGNQVTLASSKASPVTFVADGRDKTERDASGRNVKLRATLRGTQLTISSLGGESDYTVTFLSTENGRTMKVTRRITTDYLSETVFAESVYNKTDSVASLDIDPNANSNANPSDNGTFSSNDPNDRPNPNDPNPTLSQGRSGDFIVPNGTVVTGLLENTIDTKVSQNNDRFKLTVQSPDEFRGAVIEGYLTGIGRSGRVSGSSNVTFNFERITLRNGQSYDFAGYLQSVKDQNGKVVKVDTEGTAKGGSQTKETLKRGGLGAGAGAILGAIIGGGKGAAIGAVIGGGAGAGSVIAQGRDDVQLFKGSTVTIQATAPNRDRPVSEN